MKLQHKIVTLASLGFLSCANSFAETTLTAGVGFINDSNVLRKVEENSDTAIVVTPGAAWFKESGAKRFDVSYLGDFRQYNDNDDLNFNAHDFKASADLRHNQRLSSKFSANYYTGIEVPGATDQLTANLTEFTDYDFLGLTALGAYGTRKSTGQVVVTYAHNQRRFEKNEQEYRDSDENVLTARFFYRRNDVSRFLVETSYSDLDYKNPELRGNDGTDIVSLLFGMEWDIGTATRGLAKIGYQDRTFSEDRFDSRSDLAYSLDLRWAPYESTEVTAGASRKVAAAAQVDVGDLLRNEFTTGINYKLSDRTKLNADFRYMVDDVIDGRRDKRQRFGLGGEYFFRSWMKMQAQYIYEERESDVAAFEFDTTIIQVNLVMTFDR